MRQKRDPSLQPFSRDHHHGLVQVQSLTKAVRGTQEARRAAIEDFHEAWDREISRHFAEEEQCLVAYIGRNDRQRLLEEHKTIRGLVERLLDTNNNVPPVETMKQLARQLKLHIQWEERELFPRIEENLSEEQLAALLIEIEQAKQS